MRELDPAAADVRMIRGDELDSARAIHGCSRFRDDMAVDRHLSGEDDRACTLTRLGEAVLNDKNVQAFFEFSHLSKSATTTKARTRKVRAFRMRQFFLVSTHSAIAGSEL